MSGDFKHLEVSQLMFKFLANLVEFCKWRCTGILIKEEKLRKTVSIHVKSELVNFLAVEILRTLMGIINGVCEK